MKFQIFPLCLTMLMGALFSLSTSAQTPTPPSENKTETKTADGKNSQAKPTTPKPGALKPYSEVITSEAKTQEGMFLVHRIDDKIYFEIPTSLLDRDMLFYTELAQLPPGFGYPGTEVGSIPVRWSRRNNKIYLRRLSFSVRTDEGGSIRSAGRQEHDPMLRFGGEDDNSRTDPTVQTEDLGSDPIEATGFGLRNIRRVAGMLLTATTKYGEDYSMLNEVYRSLVGQRFTELLHVVKLVGGVEQTDYHSGRGDLVYQPTTRARQSAAIHFLLVNAFTLPKELLAPEILYRIQPYGTTDLVLGQQRVMLIILLQDDRIKRLMDDQALHPGQAYTVSQLVNELLNGIWSELAQPQPVIDLYRRNLQRAFIEVFRSRLVGDAATQTELRPLGLAAVTDLAGRLERAIKKTQDLETLAHLRDCRNQVERILHPKT